MIQYDMPETKAVTLRLEPGLYDRLNTQAGTTPISRHITTILEKSQNDNSVSLSISPDMAKQIDALIPPGAQHLTRAALVEYVLSLYFAQRDKTPQLVDVTPTAQPNNRPTITTRIKQRFKL